MSKFKIGDRVKILPSAIDINVREDEVGKITKIKGINNLNDIRIYDSRGEGYGCWSVNDYDIVHVIKIGRQLLFNFME